MTLWVLLEGDAAPGAMPVLSSAFESGVALVPHPGGFKGTPIDPFKRV